MDMDADRFFSALNPILIRLLHSPLHFLASSHLMTLSYAGRRSGREITIPVGYQCHDDFVDVLVSKARRKKWWRNFEIPRTVALRVRGRRVEGQALLVPSDSQDFRDAYEAVFQAMPILPKQFGVDDYDKSRGLNDDQVAVLASEGRLVRILLASDA